MSSFFDGKLLDEYSLINRDKFEMVIGLGSSKAEVRRMFCLGVLNWAGKLSSIDMSTFDLETYCTGNTGKEIDYLLDRWCIEEYHLPYNTVYDLIQTMTCKKFEDAMTELGIRGNPSAIAIANEVIRKKESNGIVQINFVNNMPLESEEDKEND